MGHTKFEYTFENTQDPFLDYGVEIFERFYEDAQPKFRFKYEIDKIDGVTVIYLRRMAGRRHWGR